MQETTAGLILREQNIGESDKLVWILTRERGLIRAFASGARRMKSKSHAAVALFCYADLILYRSRDTYRVNEATGREYFFELRQDVVKLAAAQYLCSLFLTLAPMEEEADDFLRLALNALHSLAKTDKPLLLIKGATELRLISLAGYRPELLVCGDCGRREIDSGGFSFADGQIFCEACAEDRPALGGGVLAAMRHIVGCDLINLFSFRLPKEGIEALSDLTERFVAWHAGKPFPTLDFLKGLL